MKTQKAIQQSKIRIWIVALSAICAIKAKAQNSSIQFDGSTSYIIEKSDNTSTFTESNGYFTIEAWIKISSFVNSSNSFEHTIFGKDEFSTTSRGYALRFGGSKKLEFVFANGGVWYSTITANPVLELEMWTHVAVCKSKDTIRLYINGAKVQETVHTGKSITPTAYFAFIGDNSQTKNRKFNGKIDEIKIWKSKRTDIDIKNDMTEECNTTLSDLVGYYKMNGAIDKKLVNEKSNVTSAPLFQGTIATAFGAYLINGSTKVLYVDSAASSSGCGKNNGNSWSTAFNDLNAAILVSHQMPFIEKIYVAKGTYSPNQAPFTMGTSRRGSLNNYLNTQDFTFHLRVGIELIGGFPNGGGAQNIQKNPCILDGKKLNAFRDSVYHVVLIDYSSNWGNAFDTTKLIGFIIQNGNSRLAPNSSMTVNGIGIDRRKGAGIMNYSGRVIINNCIIRNNSTALYGAGIYSGGSRVEFTNCGFFNNKAIGNLGGGLYLSAGVFVIANSIIHGNSSFAGAGLYNHDNTALTIYNCNFSKNMCSSSGNGGAMFLNTGTTNIYNTWFWDNLKGTSTTTPSASFYTSSTGVNLFKNCVLPNSSSDYPVSATGNYHLGSAATANLFDINPNVLNINDPDGPDNILGTADDGHNFTDSGQLIDLGNNTLYSSRYSLDITGKARIKTIIDIGAYEWGNNLTELYVDSSVAVSGNGKNWKLAKKTLAEALQIAWASTKIQRIYVAKGTYYPVNKPYNINTSKIGTEISTSDARDKTFQIKPTVDMYGGYPSGGGAADPKENRTILDAKYGPGANDVAYHIMLFVKSPNWSPINTTIDGFEFVNGQANTTSNLVVEGAQIPRNQGGAIYNYQTNLVITNCNFNKNTGVKTGAISSEQGGIELSYSKFIGNSATDNISIDNVTTACLKINKSSNFKINHNYFLSNTSEGSGGVCAFLETNGSVINNVFYGNTAKGFGTAIYAKHNAINNGDSVVIAFNDMVNNATSKVSGGAIAFDYLKINITGNKVALNTGSFLNRMTFNNNMSLISNHNSSFNGDHLVNAIDLDGDDNVLGNADDGIRQNYNSIYLDYINNTNLLNTITYDISGKPRKQGNGYEPGAYEGYGFSCLNQEEIYVDANASYSSHDGSSWQLAFKSLAKALDYAYHCPNVKKIYVAKGVYIPENMPYEYNSSKKIGAQLITNDLSEVTFQIRAGLTIEGGYDPITGIRNPNLYGTILSGRGIFGNQNATANHVIYINPTNEGTEKIVLDGLTITGGNAINENTNSLSLNGNTIRKDVGGGIYAYQANVEINDCKIINNVTKNKGSALYATIGVYKISNSIISGNGSYGQDSANATIFAEGQTDLKLINNVITANSAKDASVVYGDKVYSMNLINNTISKNHSSLGAAISLQNMSNAAGLTNNIFDLNTKAGIVQVGADLFLNNSFVIAKNNMLQSKEEDYTTTNNNLLGAGSGNNIFFEVPNFLNDNDVDGDDNILKTGDDGFVLKSASVAIDNGLMDANTPNRDFMGKTTNNGSKDIGAYEFYPICRQGNGIATLRNATYTASYSNRDVNGWDCYCDSFNRLLLSVKRNDGGNPIPSKLVSLKLGSENTYSSNIGGGLIGNNNGYVIADRRWKIDSQTGQNGAIKVRFFFEKGEADSVKSKVNRLNNPSTVLETQRFNIYTTAGSSAFLNPHQTTGSVLKPGTTASKTDWLYGAAGNYLFAEFETDTLTGGGIGTGGGGGADAKGLDGGVPNQLNIKLNEKVLAKIWPNPVSNNTLNLLVQEQNSSVTILDLNGKVILQKTALKFGHNKMEMNCSSGLYFVQITSSSYTQTVKILVD